MIDATPKLPKLEQADFERAEREDFKPECIVSCWHYLCENSFGFTTTHPKYSEEHWLVPLQVEAEKYHGESAMKFLQAAVDLTGLGDYYGTFVHFDTTLRELLQAAMVQSELHRGLRGCDHFMDAVAAYTKTTLPEWEQVQYEREYRHKTDGRVARTERELNPAAGDTSLVKTAFAAVRVEVTHG